MMLLREMLLPTEAGSLDGVVVEAVSSLPDDPSPEWEGDDSIHADGARGVIRMEDPRGAAVLSTSGPRVVPFVRVVKPRMHGQDVLAFQRALVAAKVRKLRPTGWHGPVSVANVKDFKRAHGIRTTSDAPFTGVYDLATHHALARYFDSYGAFLMLTARVAHIRQVIVATALYGVSVRDRIGYTQGPNRLDAVAQHLKPPRHPVATDCSGFATWCYQVGNGPDPNGHGFNVHAEEFTGSMAKAGSKVLSPRVADLILYGKPPLFDHVALFAGHDRCVSHGGASGPLVLPVHYRSDFAMFRRYL